MYGLGARGNLKLSISQCNLLHLKETWFSTNGGKYSTAQYIQNIEQAKEVVGGNTALCFLQNDVSGFRKQAMVNRGVMLLASVHAAAGFVLQAPPSGAWRPHRLGVMGATARRLGVGRYTMASAGAKAGDKVTVHYVGTLAEDGSVFDSSRKHNAPFEFTLGMAEVVAGFDRAVIGMKVGEKKSSTFPPAEGYGEPRENLKITLQPGTLPAGAKLDLGYIVVCVHVGACLVLSCA